LLRPLDPDLLYHRCDAEGLPFEHTDELEPLDESLGQERALEALEFAASMEHEGYNVYVMGSTGLGRHTLVHKTLDACSRDQAPPSDWCYVNNFRDHHSPVALRLPAGRGGEFRRDMEQLVEDLINAISAAFQSSELQRRAQEIHDEFKALEEEASTALGKRAEEQGIALLHTPNGFTLAPVRDDKMLEPDEIEKLSEEEQQRIAKAIEELKKELKTIIEKIPIWQREMRKRFKALHREITQMTVSELMRELENKYQDLPQVLAYLEQVREDVIEHGEQFRQEGPEDSQPHPKDTILIRYRVNLLVNNAQTEGAPVVVCDNPTYQNLIGRIEHVAHMGTLTTDFTLIKPGALHHANGGYLILDADKVLTQPFSWGALKRVLTAREIHIEPLERLLSLAGTISLEPQPIPVDIKVVLIGERLIYYLLKHYDPRFSLLFKVASDFAEDLVRVPENDELYARLVAKLAKQEQLAPFDRDAVARAVEHSARLAGDGEKLSLRTDALLDLLRESDYWARKAGRKLIAREDVQRAVDSANRRLSQLRERLHEEILRDTLMIDTDGAQLAQVNGLAVFQLGDHSFGTPTRISATARVGSGEIVDIERETEQGGTIHSKGVMILGAFLGRRFARNQPLSLSASLVFEQTYGEVEGDSASVAELCALLSAIGDLPLNQSLAVTGSVNQHGEVQAIGGVNEKIEGFFDICRARVLSGKQGVVIPETNVKHLMLRQDLIDAVRAGRFHIYAAKTVEQVMELLTGLSAGVPNAEGLFPRSTVNGLIQARLLEWTALRQQFTQGSGGLK
jgi:lon-related putative ATP-dependent protease